MPLRVMSFNIRYDDGAAGPNGWSARREAVLGTIRAADPDLLGLQEVTLAQLRVLAAGLPAYRLLTAPNSGLLDARRRSARRPEGPARTFHPLFDGRAVLRIDNVFVGPGVDVLCHRTLALPVAGRLPSDHFPLVVDCRLSPINPLQPLNQR